jgi:hypothetical protein
MRSSVSDKVFAYPNVVDLGTDAAVVPEAAQVFEPIKHMVASPENTSAAVDWLKTVILAVVEAVLVADAENALCAPIYPVVSIPPESPSCITTFDAPLVLTPLNITVIRLAHEGIPVLSAGEKSTDVPVAVFAVYKINGRAPSALAAESAKSARSLDLVIDLLLH